MHDRVTSARLATLATGFAVLTRFVPAAIADVSWQAPPECGAATALTARVEAQLGRALADDELSVDVVIVGTAGGYQATAELPAAGLAAPAALRASCPEAIDAIAQSLARGMRDAAAKTSGPDGAPPHPKGRSTHVDVALRAGADVLTLPSITSGLGAAVEVVWRDWTAGVQLMGWQARAVEVAGVDVGEVELIDAGLLLCKRRGPARLCAIGHAGRMTTTSATDAAGFWGAAGVEAGLSQALGQWLVAGLNLEAIGALARPEFTLGTEQKFQPPYTSFRFGFSVGLRL